MQQRFHRHQPFLALPNPLRAAHFRAQILPRLTILYTLPLHSQRTILPRLVVWASKNLQPKPNVVLRPMPMSSPAPTNTAYSLLRQPFPFASPFGTFGWRICFYFLFIYHTYIISFYPLAYHSRHRRKRLSIYFISALGKDLRTKKKEFLGWSDLSCRIFYLRHDVSCMCGVAGVKSIMRTNKVYRKLSRIPWKA